MSRKPTKICARCKHLFSADETKINCRKNASEDKLKDRACKYFKEGFPLKLSHQKKRAKEVKFDSSQSASFILRTSDTMFLFLIWEVDREGYGHWRLRQMGMDSKGLLLKEFGRECVEPEFQGEAVGVGVKRNELWHSDGVEDDDLRDEEGNVVNKLVEVKIYPKRN